MADQKDVSQTQSEGQPTGEEERNITHLWKIPIDLDHIKSLCGIVQLIISGLSLIAFICCAAGRTEVCDNAYAATYNFFEFITMSSFLTFMLWWVFHVITLDRRLMIVPWRLGELIILGAFGLMYFIADIVIAAQPCWKDSNKAAAAFGFFAVIAMGGHAYLSFQVWRTTERPNAQAAQQDAAETERY